MKYGLIATLSVPDVLGKLLQPPEPQSADDGGGVGEILEDPLWDDAEMADDEAEDLSAAERARGMREEAKWDAMVTKDRDRRCEDDRGPVLQAPELQECRRGSWGNEGNPSTGQAARTGCEACALRLWKRIHQQRLFEPSAPTGV